MRQTVEDEVQDVLVGKVIQNVLPFASPSDNVVRAENAEALGDDGDGLTFELRQFGNTRLAPGKPGNEPDPRWLTERTENSCCAFDSPFVDR
jgi:hypothetical protein